VQCLSCQTPTFIGVLKKGGGEDCVRKQNGSHFRIPFLRRSLVLTFHLDPDLGFPSDVLPEIIRTSTMRAVLPAYNIFTMRILQATVTLSPRGPHIFISALSSHALSHCMTTHSCPSKTEGTTSSVFSCRSAVGHMTDKTLK